jgi:MFS superfamily sulfate permease-like transporter
VALLLLLYRASRPHVAVLGKVPGTADQFVDLERHPENETLPDVAIVRVEAGLFFANADWVRSHILSQVADQTKAVILDAQTVPSVDVTAVRMLTELSGDLERRGVRFLIATT